MGKKKERCKFDKMKSIFLHILRIRLDTRPKGFKTMSSGPLSAYNTPNIPPRNPTIPEEFEVDNATLHASGSGNGSDISPSVVKYSKEHPLFDDLAPEDSYLDGVYWVCLFWSAVCMSMLTL